MKITNTQPNILAKAQGNLTRLQMFLLDFAMAFFDQAKPKSMYRQSIKKFLQVFEMNSSGKNYAQVKRAFEYLKQPVLNLPGGKAPLFDSQSTCEKGVMNFKLSKEVLQLF